MAINSEITFDYGSLIGVPFEWGGRGRGSYDCYGLLIECFRQKDVLIPDKQSVQASCDINNLINVNIYQWHEVEKQPGVAVLFKILGNDRVYYASHVGFTVDSKRFIHTWEKSGGVCIERLELWKRRIIGFYDYGQ